MQRLIVKLIQEQADTLRKLQQEGALMAAPEGTRPGLAQQFGFANDAATA